MNQVAVKFLGLTIAGGIVVGGLWFTGGDTVEKVGNQLNELERKIIQYDENEQTLLEKIGLIKEDASSKLATANTTIVTLEAENVKLNNQIAGLTTEVEELTADVEYLTQQLENLSDEAGGPPGQVMKKLREELAAAQVELENTKNQLVTVTAERDNLKTQIASLQSQIESLTAQLSDEQKTSNAWKDEAERANGEIEKANKAVEELGKVSDEVENTTSGKEPMTQNEIDKIDTTIK